MPMRINVLYHDSGYGVGGSRKSMVQLLRGLHPYVRAHVVASLPPELVPLLPPEAVIISTAPLWPPRRRPFLGKIGMTFRYVCHLITWVVWFSWLILRYRIDVVHANNEPTSNASLILAAWICRRPRVCHLRGTMPPMRETRWLYGLVDHYIAISDCVRRYYVDQGLIPSATTATPDDIAAERSETRLSAGTATIGTAPQCSIVYNSIDITLLERTCGQHNESNDHPLVVSMIGRVFPYKGQDLFMEVAAKVLRYRTDVTFLAHGPAPEPGSEYWPYYQMLCRKLDDLRIGSMCQLVGAYTDVTRVMQQTNIIVCCSPIDNFGRILFEAMACSVPVITFDAGGIREVGVSGTNCIIVANRDTAAMASAVMELLTTPGLCEHLAANGRETARKLFDGRRNWQPVLRIYQRLLGRNMTQEEDTAVETIDAD